MVRDSRLSSVGMAKLSMGTSLANFNESEALQNPRHFPGLEYGQDTHV